MTYVVRLQTTSTVPSICPDDRVLHSKGHRSHRQRHRAGKGSSSNKLRAQTDKRPCGTHTVELKLPKYQADFELSLRCYPDLSFLL